MSRDTDRDYGVVRKWNDVKGYGFIKADVGGQDVFVHIRGTRNRQARVGYHLESDRLDASRVMARDCVVVK
jgi:cold shock CspA family protein